MDAETQALPSKNKVSTARISLEDLLDSCESHAYTIARLLTGSIEEAEQVLVQVFAETDERIRKSSSDTRKIGVWIYDRTIDLSLSKIDPMKEAVRALKALQSSIEVSNVAESRFSGIQAELDRLPYDYKKVFLLHDVAAISSEQVAELMSLTQSEVSGMLHRARLVIYRYRRQAGPRSYIQTDRPITREAMITEATRK